MFVIKCTVFHGYTSDLKLAKTQNGVQLQNKYRYEDAKQLQALAWQISVWEHTFCSAVRSALASWHTTSLIPSIPASPVRANLIGIFHLSFFFKGKGFNSFNKDCSVPTDQRKGLDLFDLLVQIYISLYIYALKFFMYMWGLVQDVYVRKD